jgi:PAS domain S-box-containing protein
MLPKLLKKPLSLYSHFSQDQSLIYQDALAIWRRRIFSTIFLMAIITVTPSLISNIKIAIQSAQTLNVIMYSLFYLLGIVVTLTKTIPFGIRVWIGLFLFYALGLTSLLTIGPSGSGRLCIFGFSVLLSLLLGLRAGIIGLALNIATIFLFGWVVNANYLKLPPSIAYNSEHWIASGFTFFFISMAVTISTGVLVNVLENKLEKEQTLSKQLKSVNRNLKRENAERRLAEESLKKSQEKFKAITNTIHIGIYRITAAPRLKFLEANPALLKMFGFDNRDEFFAMTLSDLFQNPNDIKDLSMKMVRDGFVRSEELEFRKKNGDQMICSISAVAIKDERGEVKYYDGAIEDITERKKLEAQFQQAQKMEAIGKVAGGVAHDLNNILSGIVSYPELILMTLPPDSPLRENIDIIQKSGKRAAEIVQDLLTLARRGVSISEVVNVNKIVTEYINSPEFEKLHSFHSSIEIVTDLESELLNVMGSPIHLSKTVMNLVSNAAEAMPDGGRIVVRTENMYLDQPVTGYDDIEEGDYVVLSISDSGIGMVVDEIGKIFEPFYTKKVMGRSGTGLGMTVVWGTVKDHNGYIHVESELEKGTTFKLYFPATRQEKTVAKKAKEVIDYVGSGESILIVDDIKEQLEITSKILSKLGYSVKTASSGEEAIEYLTNETVDLVILDMIMTPGIDGLETYRRIIRQHPGQKAVLASGFSETDKIKEAQRLGAGSYVKKPYTIENIGLAIRAEFDKEKKAA